MRFVLARLCLFAALSLAQVSSINDDIATNAAVEAILDGTANTTTLYSEVLTSSSAQNSSIALTTTVSPSLDPQRRNGLFLQHPAVPEHLNPEKHFHEATFDNHYDGRFTNQPVSYSTRHGDLHNLVVSYLQTMNDIGIETWLMHGTLLGWWWNKKILAWDFDVDVQMATESLQFVGQYYNMSVWNFDAAGTKTDNGGPTAISRDGNDTQFRANGRTYLLEINPFHVLHDGGEMSDKNVIDGRWIDTSTGLYVDITCLWKAVDHEAGSGILTGKDGHSFREKYIFPLRETTFEGVDALIPNAYTEVLSKEYGPQALVKGSYKGHVFDEKTKEWVSQPPNSTITPE